MESEWFIYGFELEALISDHHISSVAMDKYDDKESEKGVNSRAITSSTRIVATQKDSPISEVLLLERPKFLSWSIFRLFACLFVTYLCNAQNGFDSNTFGGVSDMPNFKQQFGTNIASTTGFLAAIYVIGKSFCTYLHYQYCILKPCLSLIYLALSYV